MFKKCVYACDISVDKMKHLFIYLLDTPEKLLEDHEVQEFASILVDKEHGAGLEVCLNVFLL